ncbi:MAG: hypothetical protein KBH39_13960, partial [Chitinophagales bacterium]|nr:hypothetical protein [Chitinophagales bacterium]
MRRKLTLILSFIALSIVSNAQGAYGKTKEIEEFYKRKVIIVKEEYDKDVIKKLEKKGEKGDVTLYKHTIDQYNANFKKAVQAMWPKQTTFSIKTLDQTLDLKKDKKKYAVVYIGRIARSENGSGYHQVEGIEFDASAIFNDKLDTSNRYSSGLHNSYIFFNLIEDIYKFPIILAGMNCSFPSVADFACAVQYATWYMQGRLTDKNMSVTIDEVPDEYVKLLTEKTLYIRESDINEKCTAEDIA